MHVRRRLADLYAGRKSPLAESGLPPKRTRNASSAMSATTETSSSMQSSQECSSTAFGLGCGVCLGSNGLCVPHQLRAHDRKAAGMVLLDVRDEFLPDLAAQIPGLR